MGNITGKGSMYGPAWVLMKAIGDLEGRTEKAFEYLRMKINTRVGFTTESLTEKE